MSAALSTAQAGSARPVPATFAVPSPAATLVPLQMHATGTYYIPAHLRGYEGGVDLLVDTGSSYLVINEQLLAAMQKAGTAEFARNIGGAMADGSRKVIPVYRLSALELGDGCWVEDVEAAVFPGATRPILGMSVLSRLSPFTMSAEPATLSLQKCAAAPTEEVAEQQPDAGPSAVPAAEGP